MRGAWNLRTTHNCQYYVCRCLASKLRIVPKTARVDAKLLPQQLTFLKVALQLFSKLSGRNKICYQIPPVYLRKFSDAWASYSVNLCINLFSYYCLLSLSDFNYARFSQISLQPHILMWNPHCLLECILLFIANVNINFINWVGWVDSLVTGNLGSSHLLEQHSSETRDASSQPKL